MEINNFQLMECHVSRLRRRSFFFCQHSSFRRTVQFVTHGFVGNVCLFKAVEPSRTTTLGEKAWQVHRGDILYHKKLFTERNRISRCHLSPPAPFQFSYRCRSINHSWHLCCCCWGILGKYRKKENPIILSFPVLTLHGNCSKCEVLYIESHMY